MEVKERCKNFKEWEVLSIQDDRKTQFREIIKPQPCLLFSDNGIVRWVCEKRVRSTLWNNGTGFNDFCPYKIGDRIIGKETWQKLETWVEYGSEFYDITKKDSFGSFIEYKATNESKWEGKWKPSTHMSREHSRILLEVTDIRVERLQDISGDDAIKEGVKQVNNCPPMFKDYGNLYPMLDCVTAYNSFKGLWDSINAKKHPWASNSWTWVVTFKRIK
jgi:hypothetical protein